MPIPYIHGREDQVSRMPRITVIDLSDSVVVLRVEGRITGWWVEELRRTCAAHAFAAHTFAAHDFADEIQLTLELSEVSFADAAGIALLKELRSRGADLIRPTPFVAEQRLAINQRSLRVLSMFVECTDAARRRPGHREPCFFRGNFHHGSVCSGRMSARFLICFLPTRGEDGLSRRLRPSGSAGGVELSVPVLSPVLSRMG